MPFTNSVSIWNTLAFLSLWFVHHSVDIFMIEEFVRKKRYLDWNDNRVVLGERLALTCLSMSLHVRATCVDPSLAQLRHYQIGCLTAFNPCSPDFGLLSPIRVSVLAQLSSCFCFALKPALSQSLLAALRFPARYIYLNAQGRL